MSVLARFFNWQSSGLDWDAPQFEACAPGLRTVESHILDTWGGQRLGCHGDRNIINGTSPSSHAFGAAFDWRYQPTNPADPAPFPGRDFVPSTIIPWIISNSDELGIQAIHDYVGGRIWRPPGTSGRPADSDGWRAQPLSSQMGRSWAVWLHLELHPDYWENTTPIPDRLTPPTTPPAPTPPSPTPPTDPGPLPPGGTTVVNVTVQTIRRGSTGGWVRKAQAILAANFGQDIGPIDGAFGPRTEDAIRNVQQFFGLTADGICGPKTWTLLLSVAP